MEMNSSQEVLQQGMFQGALLMQSQGKKKKN